ncbi:hypothetical protein ACFVIZ_04695 [Streptomyces anulatus]|uniref:hypothetical protein n=1 Tax=Streptomyces anulatus TaxID=1892 RepID=UPI00362726A0
MTRRLCLLPATLLTAITLTACSAETLDADNPKPPATTNPSGAPGGTPDGSGLPLAEAIGKIPSPRSQSENALGR